MARAFSARSYLLAFAVTTAGLLAAVALLNWRIDPLQYYRRAAYPPLLSMQARYQNPGLARNYDYDAIILGTSVSLGLDLRDLAAQTGWRPLNLAMSGATAHEQRLLLDVALRTGRVKHVLWDLNYEYYRGSPDAVSDYDGAFPAYFYDTDPLDKIPHYLLNVDATKTSLHILLRNLLHKPSPFSLEDLTISPPRPTGAAVLLTQWTASRSPHWSWSPAQNPADFALDKTRASFDLNVLPVIRAHPEVTWDLWFPPVTTLYQTMVREQLPAGWENMFAWKQSILAKTASLPQVRLHDFQGWTSLILDLDHYVDGVHCDMAAHRLLIHEILSGAELATPARLVATADFLHRAARPEAVEALLHARPSPQAPATENK